MAQTSYGGFHQSGTPRHLPFQRTGISHGNRPSGELGIAPAGNPKIWSCKQNNKLNLHRPNQSRPFWASTRPGKLLHSFSHSPMKMAFFKVYLSILNGDFHTYVSLLEGMDYMTMDRGYQAWLCPVLRASWISQKDAEKLPSSIQQTCNFSSSLTPYFGTPQFQVA